MADDREILAAPDMPSVLELGPIAWQRLQELDPERFRRLETAHRLNALRPAGQRLRALPGGRGGAPGEGG